ncbi:DEAD/DEAH box helicase [Salimicrobium halophilum]|uniref:Helicase conserved C-terminal domain-containing protein n=1 Tax=Salimicrobium halophilum TaxID=86666 RepID=A0A1G8PTJ7_9BACI|nr:SNF2-related protein [Salimicrobium halophilum]SDI95791.1 Helicase conserved C-terminal domain-containing protein [Salimicrobium halophilum]
MKVITDILSEEENLSDWNTFNLACTAIENKYSHLHKEELQCMKHLPTFTPMEHQLSTAKKVIHTMGGRAILADEVGLGKTMEAGLILKEYLLRNMVKKVLILAPASLVNQWASELSGTFYIQTFTPSRKSADWENWDITISSLDYAKQEKHASVIKDIDYDLLIIDEAHRLKNEQTKNFRFVSSISKTYCLLLTATPLQNSITDVYNLTSILRPGYLGNLQEFKKKYKTSKDTSHINQLLKQVMVRHNRREIQFSPSERNIRQEPILLHEKEKHVYSQIDGLLKDQPAFTNIMLKREFCSSLPAFIYSLQGVLPKLKPEERDKAVSLIQTLTRELHHSKAIFTKNLLKNSEEKYVLFTEFKATQLYLQWFFQKYGISSVPFNGKFKKSKREWMTRLFEQKAQVLIATDAAAEGINLQFCSRMIHYDLPWNPMKLEQRIGRIHRYGQEHDVEILYPILEETIEEVMFHRLLQKTKTFHHTIGKMEKLLVNQEED